MDYNQPSITAGNTGNINTLGSGSNLAGSNWSPQQILQYIQQTPVQFQHAAASSAFTDFADGTCWKNTVTDKWYPLAVTVNSELDLASIAPVNGQLFYSIRTGKYYQCLEQQNLASPGTAVVSSNLDTRIYQWFTVVLNLVDGCVATRTEANFEEYVNPKELTRDLTPEEREKADVFNQILNQKQEHDSSPIKTTPQDTPVRGSYKEPDPPLG